MAEKAQIMDENGVRRAVTRISHEIVEANQGTEGLCIAGIYTRGAVLAGRIAQKIGEIEGAEIPVGFIDITRNRDDDKKGEGDRTQLPFDITGKRVVLVDDVIYTGRSVRAAIDTLMALGRPQKIQLAALIDRGHRELPIRADFVGKNLPTARNELVKVRLQEQDGTEEVVILDGKGEVK